MRYLPLIIVTMVAGVSAGFLGFFNNSELWMIVGGVTFAVGFGALAVVGIREDEKIRNTPGYTNVR